MVKGDRKWHERESDVLGLSKMHLLRHVLPESKSVKEGLIVGAAWKRSEGYGGKKRGSMCNSHV